MTLHPYTTLPELAEFCELCHEYPDKAKRIKLNVLVFNRVRMITRSTGEAVTFLGIKFIER